MGMCDTKDLSKCATTAAPSTTETSDEPTTTGEGRYAEASLLTFWFLGFTCTGKPDGNYSNPDNCQQYCSCMSGGKTDHDCPEGQTWHADRGVCDTKDLSKCGTKTTAAPETTPGLTTTAEGTE